LVRRFRLLGVDGAEDDDGEVFREILAIISDATSSSMQLENGSEGKSAMWIVTRVSAS
jgi:hypothetical protein